MYKKLYSSEQVSCGHPDKICDQIADSILDECLNQDKNSRVACEVLIKNKNIILAGEITSLAKIDYSKAISNTLNKIGLKDTNSYNIQNFITEQSADISQGVDIGGAGDQGIMFGFACNDTPEKMPLGYMLATKCLLKLKDKKLDFLLPDAKAQVTLKNLQNKTTMIDTFLVSTQHIEKVEQKEIQDAVKKVMLEVSEEYKMNKHFRVLVNPTGKFVIGGSDADAGVTGRKIICDTYGGYAHHGGGAFSGKDPTKVDRSAAYMARYLAKYVLAKGYADICEIQLGYAIGIAEPVSIHINCFNTEKLIIKDIHNEIITHFDLTPNGIIRFLNLKRPIYSLTSSYGHFGKDNLPWEKIK